MYYQNRPRRRRRFALLGALCIAGAIAGIAAGKDGKARKARLEVTGATSPVAATVGGSSSMSRALTQPAPAGQVDAQAAAAAAAADAAVAAALGAPRLNGDAALRGALKLSSMVPAADGAGYDAPVGRGARARLTIDPVVQEHAMKLLRRSRAPKAAIVVMRPDGRILALAGRKEGPPVDEDAYDLATTRWAPAASVFKIVTASALLQAGVGPDDRVCFHGGLRSVMESNLVDDRRDNRCESLSFAVAESNNAIVAKLFHQHLDADRLARTARALGFGSAPVFALAADPSQVDVPSGALEQARFAAGFWSSELTALDGALLANAVATGGMRVVPRIVDAVIDAAGGRHAVVAPKAARVMPRAVAQQIGRMMVRTTESGTARRVFRSRRAGSPLDGVAVAGKTGSLDQDKDQGKPYMGYSWFVAYAPADDPQVVVSVVLGNQERWWLKAHMCARDLLETALTRRTTQRAMTTATARAK